MDAAGSAAKVVACAICGENVDAGKQAAAHAKALREIFEAVGRVAEAVDRQEADRLRAELEVLHDKQRANAERLIRLAASAKPAAAPAATVTP